MLKPIEKVEEINTELIYKMTRDCMNIEWLKDFFISEKEEIFAMMINKDWVIIIRAKVLDKLKHEHIAQKVLEIIRKRKKICIDSSDAHVKV